MKLFFLLLCFCQLVLKLSAQNIGIGTDAPHASAKLDVQSKSSGILIPRMTTIERNAIPNPEKGLMVFDNDKSTFMYFDGRNWRSLLSGDNNSPLPVEYMEEESEQTRNFGYGVSIDSNYAAISSFQTGNDGFVYVYKKTSDGQWLKQAKLAAPNAGASDWFGHATDINDDYLIVGAPYKVNGAGVAAGMAFIYKRDGDNWNMEASLERSFGAVSEKFGFDVAIDVNSVGVVRAVVSAPSYGNLNAPTTGLIYVYRKNVNNIWVVEQNITPAGLLANSQAGYSVDIAGDLVVFGAPFADHIINNNAYYNRGRAFFYRHNGTQWIQEYSEYGGYDYGCLGFSVSVSDGKVALGSPYLRSGNEYFGMVRLYHKNTGQWGATSLYAPVELRENGFARYGMSVSLYGNNLLVGAPAGLDDASPDNYAGSRPGNAYLYSFLEFPGAYWVRFSLLQSFNSGFVRNDDRFGHAVAIGGGSYIVSDHRKDSDSRLTVGAVRFGAVE